MQKTDNDGECLTADGRVFQAVAAATGNARSPSVDRRVAGTRSVSASAERRHRRGNIEETMTMMFGQEDIACHGWAEQVRKMSRQWMDDVKEGMVLGRHSQAQQDGAQPSMVELSVEH